jgi:hypothetical protein
VEGFSEEQILDQVVELSVHIFSQDTPSPLRLATLAYIVDNLRAGVLIETNTLARWGASIDSKRKKLTIGDTKLEDDIVFKTPEPYRHAYHHSAYYEIIRQQRLYYSTRASSASTAITSSRLRAKLHEAAPSIIERASPHLTVADLYK